MRAIIWHYSDITSNTGKSSWKQLWYLDIFTQPVAVDECRFEFLFDANPANGDPYGCILGLTGIQVLLLLVNQ